jgi:superfamily II DNA or RNA helicase
MVILKIFNTHVKIDGTIPFSTNSKLDEQLSYNHPGYQFMSGGRGGYGLRGNTGGWDGKVRLFLSNKFSIGLLSRVKRILSEDGINFSVVDTRSKINYGNPLKIDSSKFEIRDYQRGAIVAAKKHESGVIRMATGCHKKGTQIIMFDGSTKYVEDIVIGDKIMGPDSTERTVTELCRGSDRMISIKPKFGNSFVINENHILSFKKDDKSIIDMKFSDYESLPEYKKKSLRLFKSIINFRKECFDPAISGYLVGSRLKYSIPESFKLTSAKWRKDLLSGIIDRVGIKGDEQLYIEVMHDKFADDLIFLFNSLGFYSYKILPVNISDPFRVIIHGDLKDLNLKKYFYQKNIDKTMEIEFSFDEAGHSEYYGFNVDMDNRYLLSDFIVTHNSGKTLTIASLVAEYNIPTVIYVIGIELLYQMKETIETAYGVKCGIVGGGEVDTNYDITIMTIWSAASAFNKKIKIEETDFSQDSKFELKDAQKIAVKKKVEEAQLFIFDECQYAASETLQFIHKASTSARHRFLFSGTPWRDTGDDILIEAVGGERIYDLNATKLINLGFLVAPEIHFLNVPVVRNVGSNYHDVYSNYIVENEDRNNLIIKAARKLVDAGKKLLILVVRVNHGKKIVELLEKDFKVKFLDGGKSTKNRLETIKEMKDGKLEVLVASKIFDQGVDIPELDALILAGSGKSSGRALQRIGRVIRLSKGKKKAIIVDFYDNCKYLKEHSESRIKIYESEPGFKIIMPKKEVLQYPNRKQIDWSK